MNNKLLTLSVSLTILGLVLSACGSSRPPATPTATTRPPPTPTSLPSSTPLPTSTPTPTATPSPTPEPKPGLITFDSNREGSWGIYMISAEGTGRTDLLTIHPKDDSFSSWSPDGKKIAFSSGRTGNAEIYTIHANSSGLTRLTDNPATDTMPAWSPDGQKIAFISDRDGKPNLYIMQANGADQVHPAASIDNLVDGLPPTWSPDGQKIAFTAGNKETKLVEIYVMNIDGTGLEPLTTEGALGPAWSPDGKKIAFFRPEDGKGGNREIYVMNADGTDKTRITDNPAEDTEPSWSPDGRYIAFASDRNGSNDIYVVNADGSGERQLTNDPADEFNPQWSPPGIALSDEPWFGPPFCLRDTNGDFKPDTASSTFSTKDLLAFIQFPYRNMKDGAQYSVTWKPANGISVNSVEYWNSADSGETGFHISYDPASGFGAGKLIIELFIGDELVQEIECDVVKP